MLFTLVILLSGALQLLPWLRREAPRVHRWNGRLFLGSALLMSPGGLWMLATRCTIGSVPQKLAIAVNALLIGVFAGLASRLAMARRFDLHRRWALRLWLVVGGVWFFRIGLMAWVVANQGPAGFDPRTFSEPFLSFLAFAQFLLPLALLQSYFAAQRSRSAAPRLAMAGVLGVATLLTAAGIGAATMLMWLPPLQAWL
ncbi:MAG: DUF2306 domain-containing protein [Pseudomonadota bacterium]|nr:DUF2306 domain-containing protein [Pseudomonadota bacterium]